ncbi:Dynein assembly factor [Micractinium conductrix]|uniref:Dynein assembly factor n=1 Tax=Micractinium conductrix TaxID=554055 RepID=A0A2P6VG35_9CHLO|nr:Dynein assembly factor [Micractinium conductrix]|eukprot:PSC73054.1 Dynein assembly factor [Micractinium conductrix]
MRMDGPALLAVCKAHKLYQTPALNDRLYANFRGFTELGGLEAYTGLRSLFLEGNSLGSVDGLPPLPELRCLFLQQNPLTGLSPALAALPQLDTLNIAGNTLDGLGGLAGCGALRTLVASDNRLGPDVGAVAALAACTQLESLDLQNNKLEEGPALLELLKGLPDLKCLYLRGNPLVSSMRSYRKTVVAALPALTYLDDRPVFELERLCAEAWSLGGLEAERGARAAYHERQAEAEKKLVEALRGVREAGWRKRREALGLPLEGGDPDLEGWQPAQEMGGAGAAEEEQEPPELLAARARLAAFTATKQGEEAPELADADADATVEERRANRAALQSDAEAAGDAGSSSPGPCSPTQAAPLPAAASAEEEVPEARLTVSVCDGSAGGSAAQQKRGDGDGNAGSAAGPGAACASPSADSCASPAASASPPVSVAGAYEEESGDDCLGALD